MKRPYPEIVVDAVPSVCDCRLRDYLETVVCHVGPQYCQVHNVIILGGLYEQKDLEDIDAIVVEIINHETLHWLLSRIFGELASDWLDTDTVSDFMEIATS